MPVKVNEKKLYESIEATEYMAREALRVLSKAAVEALVGASPVWSGSYLASHRVAVGETVPVITEGPTDMRNWSNARGRAIYKGSGQFENIMIPTPLTEMEGQMLQATVNAKLDQQIDTGINLLPHGIGVVKIANSIEHADDVECGNVALNVPVYAVYHATINYVRVCAKQILSSVKQRLGMSLSFRIRGNFK